MSREWMHDVDQQLRELHGRTADLPVRIKPGAGGGGGGSGTENYHFTRTSLAEFPETTTVPVGAIGRVDNNEDPDHGKMYIQNKERTEWRCFTHWQ